MNSIYPVSSADTSYSLQPPSGTVGALHVVYALYAAGLFLHGIPSLFGLPPFAAFLFLIAGVIAFVRSNDVKGTWAESHIHLAKRMFWVTLIFTILTTLMVFGGFVGIVVSFFSGEILSSLLWLPVIFGGILFGIFYVLWMAFYIIKGWLRLNDRRAV